MIQRRMEAAATWATSFAIWARSIQRLNCRTWRWLWRRGRRTRVRGRGGGGIVSGGGRWGRSIVVVCVSGCLRMCVYVSVSVCVFVCCFVRNM